MYQKLLVLLAFIINVYTTHSQDLMSMLDSIDSRSTINYETGTFKSVRLINGYTSEIAAKNELVFSISHRFGRLNTGFYNFYGLDESLIRFGFEYGLNDRIALGIGRGNFEKLYDGFIKIKLLNQSGGAKNMPVTLTILEGIAIKTIDWVDPSLDYPYSARLYYVHEVFISRKFNDKVSAQMVPLIVHRNMVKESDDQNLVAGIGLGGRYKITNRFTFCGEYYYLLPGKTADDFYNSLSLGFEIETGGHVFQLNLSNSKGMTEKAFLPETTGNWFDGDIHFGFNIIRLFNLN